MHHHFRQGSLQDLHQIKNVAIAAWTPYQNILAPEHWTSLNNLLNKDQTYIDLLNQSHCLVCETASQEVVGMAFLVPQGNPTAIYESHWSYIRFVSVKPEFGGQGIGRQLTERCIEHARKNKETIVALHTSEIMVKARKLYENLGFKIHRAIPPSLGKRYWVYILEL